MLVRCFDIVFGLRAPKSPGRPLRRSTGLFLLSAGCNSPSPGWAEYWPPGNKQVNEALSHILKVRIWPQYGLWLNSWKACGHILDGDCGCESTRCRCSCVGKNLGSTLLIKLWRMMTFAEDSLQDRWDGYFHCVKQGVLTGKDAVVILYWVQ